VTVAARPPVAPLFQWCLKCPGPCRRRTPRVLARLDRASRFDAALVFRNSFRSALLPGDGYSRTVGVRAIVETALDARHPASIGMHQARYYQQLTESLGFPASPLVSTRRWFRPTRGGSTSLQDAGWNGRLRCWPLRRAPRAAGQAMAGPLVRRVASVLARDGSSGHRQAPRTRRRTDLAESLGTGIHP
jgi:hypothetical protein